ncbi:MAG: 2'-5' RNA ligase family protein [Actinophytocola sp.]|uniref:2'-5' RNA ligase family protein n=1 Tax=Actinophytocola sp. TaxID=1872138 RepID=UPI00132C0D54|nr:2'-5' RNA ligase family protein [Actinophytocola sp.]MPZ83464.1 2'-5' RNA ligase family protein [Actinophytocola sp.]
MAQALEFYFDDEADAAVRGLWRRLDKAGVPSLAARTHGRHRPHVTFALASAIPPKTRDALREDLRLLSIPHLWLYSLSAFSASDMGLMITAVVDTELLAVHSAVHDVLAKKVMQPSAYYLPGSWVPHCTLAHGLEPTQVTAAFAALFPLAPIKARVSEAAVCDTHTGETDTVLVTG